MDIRAGRTLTADLTLSIELRDCDMCWQASGSSRLTERRERVVGMDYARLGAAGLKVSRICLGCMTFGSKRWRDWMLEASEARPIIRHALDAGINHFDTADYYSLGESEVL